MAKTFRYRVCQTQMARVTYVNGQWQGLQVPEVADADTVFNSCPMVWDYLESAGRDGWELVASAPQIDATSGQHAANLLFLKKEVSASDV